MSVLSKLTGGDAEHNANVAQSQANQQYKLANQYGALGANVYAGLLNQGNQQYGAYSNNYLSLLNDYAGLSGLGSNLIQQPLPAPTAGQTAGATQPVTAQTVPGAATTPTAGQPGYNPLTNPGNFNGNTGQWANAGKTRAPTPQQILTGQAGQPQMAATQSTQANNPYGLDQYQQQQLNQSTALIAQSAQQAQAAFAQHMAAAGINDPRALEVGNQQLQEHFAALTAETQTKFYEQVKQDKLQALQQILSGISQYGSQGISEQEAAGTGYLGLASGAQGLSAAQQSTSLTQQQNAQEQTGATIAFLTKLFGLGAASPLGGASTPPIA